VDRLRRIDIGAILLGLLILGVGIYYVLANTFGLQMAELDWDKIWPLAVVALGIGIIWGAWSRMTPHGHGPTSS
jgi:cell division protein FtsX